MSRAINIAECAQKYGVSDQTVERWLKRGYIQGIKLPGGHWRFRPQDLAEFESSCLENVFPAQTTNSTNIQEEHGGYDGLKTGLLDAYQHGKLIKLRRRNGTTNG